jgi:uncharacterized membrane protein
VDGVLRGNTWVIAAMSSVFSAVALLGLNRLQRVDARAVVAHFSFVSLLFAIGSLFVFPATKPWHFSGATVLMLLGVGITGTIGQIFLTKAFAVGDPSRVSVVGLSQVGFGALLELIFFDRTFHGLTLLGMGLIIVPSAWLLLHRAAPELPDRQTRPAGRFSGVPTRVRCEVIDVRCSNYVLVTPGSCGRRRREETGGEQQAGQGLGGRFGESKSRRDDRRLGRFGLARSEGQGRGSGPDQSN